jgi:hypothetical protein
MKTVLILTVMIFLSSCDPHGDHGFCQQANNVLEVSPQHATRVFVTYTCIHGDTITGTYHHSNTLYFKNDTIYCGDFIRGKRPYGKIK